MLIFCGFTGAVVQPLPSSYCIFRAPSQASGMCWLDALEISIRNDSALVRSVSNKSASGSTTHETQWSESDYEKHFDHGELNIFFCDLLIWKTFSPTGYVATSIQNFLIRLLGWISPYFFSSYSL